jgi:Mg-chelatase subunit ChlD
MRKRRQIELFSISFLDLLSGALGAIIILFVAIPKEQNKTLSSDQKLNQAIEQTLKESQDELVQVKKQLEEANKKLASKDSKKDENSNKDLDVGFKFKGKEILFIIDTSLSMVDEDRMGQVKAGLKMLITSLSPEYKIDVIRYPNGSKAPFKTLWGAPQDNNSLNKMEAFYFIYSLQPFGGTPTRDVLLFALENYESISDIVLLSDGAPTFHNSNKKDSIDEILEIVRKENSRQVQINCIGVGSEFVEDKKSDRYKFLSLLAEQGKGFFVGF